MLKKNVFILLCSFFSSTLTAKELIKKSGNTVDSIFVSKSTCSMALYAKGKIVKSYKIAIGQQPIGHKKEQGDNRTPEGHYFINGKNPYSKYYKNLGISYPNELDKKRASKLGLNPGGEIKIHGYADEKGGTSEMSIRYAYTWGCIAVTNNEMNEIYHLVKTGAVIQIVP